MFIMQDLSLTKKDLDLQHYLSLMSGAYLI